MNKYLPHLFVLPEDDANRQLATGCQLGISHLRTMKVLPVAGGWTKVLDEFEQIHIAQMDQNPKRSMVLLIDFDKQADRLLRAKAVIPSRLIERVFVLGDWNEPEDFKSSLEGIGNALAKECREDTASLWEHELLKHNGSEVARLRERVRTFLF